MWRTHSLLAPDGDAPDAVPGLTAERLLGLVPLPVQADQDGEEAALAGAPLRQSRTAVGLRAAELASMVGITPDKLSKIEHGTRRMSPNEAPRFAGALGVPIRYLVLGDAAWPSMAFRLSEPGPAGASPARERAAEVAEAAERLTRFCGLAPARRSLGGAFAFQAAAELPEAARTRPEAVRQGRVLAQAVREGLRLGIAGIGDLPGLIEMNFAADVVLSPFGPSVAGLCAHTAHHALLAANTDFTGGNVRFTLAHELGHHLLSDPREVIDEDSSDLYASRLTERRVNSFAAHLLLPEDAIRSALAWLDADGADIASGTVRGRQAVGYLMASFGVSMTAALHQLADIKEISFDDARTLSASWKASSVLADAGGFIAPRASLIRPSREVRVPPRLLRAAIDGAQSGAVGTSVVARLLGRPDDEELFSEIMDMGELAGSASAL